MKVYFHDNVDTDQRLPHEGEPATLKDLEALGVLASNIPDQVEVDRIAEERGYKNRDEVFPFIVQWHNSTEIVLCSVSVELYLGQSISTNFGREIPYNDQKLLRRTSPHR
jgi:hypothetical protein